MRSMTERVWFATAPYNMPSHMAPSPERGGFIRNGGNKGFLGVNFVNFGRWRKAHAQARCREKSVVACRPDAT